jgi:predicted TIM-barrel fold metal-dependent hydrolase
MAHLPILDAHVHLWDAARFPLAWTRGMERLDRSHEAGEYAREAAAGGVDACMLVEVDVAPAQRREEAEDLARRCAARQAGAIAAVACADPREEGFITQVRALATSPSLRGVRWLARNASTAEELARSPAVRRSLDALGELDLAFDLNAPTACLEPLAGLAAACPRTRFVLDHCGYADPVAFGVRSERAAQHDLAHWRRAIAALAAQPNVACKISGVINRLPAGCRAEDLAAPVRECLAAFGPERVIFGSDWPVCGGPGTLAAWVSAVREIVADRAEPERERLFSGNARSWYALSP